MSIKCLRQRGRADVSTGDFQIARHASLDGPAEAGVYLSGGALERAAFLVVRSNRPSAEMEQEIRSAIAAVDPLQPVLLIASMQSLISDSIAGRRFLVLLLTATAGLALLMSAAGVYGVTSYTTSLRTREIGVRIALGATAGSVHGHFFRRSFPAVAAGLLAGSGLALAGLRLLRGIPAGVDSESAAPPVLAGLLVTAAAAAACWIPVRRATRVDPVSALRHE